MKLSRIDRIQRTFAVASLFPQLNPADVTAVQFALLPPRSESPTSGTVWTSSYTVTGGNVTVLLAGPDADPTGAFVVSGTADLWAKASDPPEVEAVKIPDRITLLGALSPYVPPVTPPPSGGTVGLIDSAVLDTSTIAA